MAKHPKSSKRTPLLFQQARQNLREALTENKLRGGYGNLLPKRSLLHPWTTG